MLIVKVVVAFLAALNVFFLTDDERLAIAVFVLVLLILVMI